MVIPFACKETILVVPDGETAVADEAVIFAVQFRDPAAVRTDVEHRLQILGKPGSRILGGPDFLIIERIHIQITADYVVDFIDTHLRKLLTGVLGDELSVHGAFPLHRRPAGTAEIPAVNPVGDQSRPAFLYEFSGCR